MSINAKIGAFKGKKAWYNQMILKVLLKHGSLTTWGIAKRLFQMKTDIKNPEIAYARTQKIYSVIGRKDGRLEELRKKEYVNLENKNWDLAFKGFAILIKKPELLSEVNDYYFEKPPVDLIKFGKKNVSFPFGVRVQINKRQFLDTVKSLSGRSMLMKIVKSMEKLVLEGIDLDRISTTNLLLLITNEMKDFLQTSLYKTHES